MTNDTTLNVELFEMTDLDWNDYVSRVSTSDDFFFQYGMDMTEENLGLISEMTPGVIYKCIYDESEGVKVGYVGIAVFNDNIEFYVFREFRNNGYATRAAQILIDDYFSGRLMGQPGKKVEAETLGANKASIRVLEKLGFTKKAIGFRVSMDEDTDNSFTAIRAYVKENEASVPMEERQEL